MNIKPFRDYDEHDVVNFFAWGGTFPQEKGAIVKVSAGWLSSDELELLGSPGATYAGTVSERWGVKAKVALAGTGDKPLGMLLYACKEVDENGEKLIFNPRKAAEMQVALSGQAVPVLAKGLVLYSGVTGTVTAGDNAYIDDGGVVNVIQKNGAAKIGMFLGAKDSQGYALLKLDI